MEKKRILIVDDEQDLCEILQFNLNAAGYEADVAYSAEEAQQQIVNSKLSSGKEQQIVNSKLSNCKFYDLLLLDVMLPGQSGFELAERLKADAQTSHIPIIFLTAKDAEDDTLTGFGLGADDYVTKPFSVREVVARVNAVLKRNQPRPLQEEGRMQCDGLVVDTVKKNVTIDGNDIDLTRTEFDLLVLLLSHRGQVFSRRELIDSVWPDDVIVTERSVDVNITRLRKKMGAYAARILTRQRFGYYFK